MSNEQRLFLYEFLSRVMADVLDIKFIQTLKNDRDFLEYIGPKSALWFESHDLQRLYDELNTDFSSMFLINTQPIESLISQNRQETPTGLANETVAFYIKHGFDVDMSATDIAVADHLSLEFLFMKSLIELDDKKTQDEFLKEHLSPWVISYMISMKNMAQTPFYRDICTLTAEFIAAELSRD